MNMTDFWMFVGAFALVMAATVWFISWMQKEFFWAFWKVKMARGSKLLVRVFTPIRTYYTTGVISENILIYNDAQKQTHRLKMRSGVLYRTMNVNSLDVDEEKDCFITHESEGLSGWDSVKIDGLIKRALYKPRNEEGMTKILLVMVGACLLGIAFLAFWLYTMDGRFEELKVAIDAINKGVIA